MRTEDQTKPERCDGPGIPNIHTSPAEWCSCKELATPEAKAGWEEEFEDRFVGEAYDCIPAGFWKEMKGEVFAWIRYLLSQAREEEHRKCVSAVEQRMDKNGYDKVCGEYNCACIKAYHSLILSALSAVKPKSSE